VMSFSIPRKKITGSGAVVSGRARAGASPPRSTGWTPPMGGTARSRRWPSRPLSFS
jgi:hypothetical protein